MEEKKTVFRRLADFLTGKGFYIVLFICTAVIGVSAWILLSAGGDDRGADVGGLDDPAMQVAGVSPSIRPPVTPATPGVTDAFSPGTAVTPPPVKTETRTPPPSVSPTPAPAPSSAAPAAAQEDEEEPEELSFIWPVIGEVENGFAIDTLMYSRTMGDWRVHPAYDIASPIGTKVMAAADGRVKEIYTDDLLGTTVVIEHTGGLETIYANLAGTPAVSAGDSVTLGAVIGAVGDTALGETGEVTHLHFAMTAEGGPADPGEYLPQE